jgi:hypothetical protein
MFIIKTQSSSKNATKYYTHRLVESKRDSVGKVYKQTILNLGSNYAVVEQNTEYFNRSGVTAFN